MNMPFPVAVGLWVVLGLAILLVMWRGWRGARARGAKVVGALPVAPEVLGAARTEPMVGTYVSSTTGGDWLGRVVARDLGVRSAATVQVFDAGVRIERRGATDVFVPAASVRGVRRTPGMAGKYVGGEGIVVIEWAASAPDGAPAPLDTGIRTQHKADRALLVAAVDSLTASAVPGAPGHPGLSASPDTLNDPKELQ